MQSFESSQTKGEIVLEWTFQEEKIKHRRN